MLIKNLVPKGQLCMIMTCLYVHPIYQLCPVNRNGDYDSNYSNLGNENSDDNNRNENTNDGNCITNELHFN